MVRSSVRCPFGLVPFAMSLGLGLTSFSAAVYAQTPVIRELLVAEAPVPALAELTALQEAREIFVQARKKAEQSLHLAIEGAIVDSAGAGKHAETRRLRGLQEVLRRTHGAPEGAVPGLQPAIDRYQATMRVADRFLDSYYSEAIGVLSREKRFDEASLLATERNTWKGPPIQSVGRPPTANPPPSLSGNGSGTTRSRPAAQTSSRGPVASPPDHGASSIIVPPAGTPARSPMGPPIPPMTTGQMISLQAPSIEATNPSPDLEVVSAIWTADPRYFQGKASRVIATESVRRKLKVDRVIVSSAVFGEMNGLMAPKCLELTLKTEGGSPFLLRLHEGSEVVARELTPPLDKVNARPIRGSALGLMLASWGLRDEERGTSVAAEYAARFEKGKNVAASTALFGEIEFGKPKVLRSLWRVGRTLLYVKQAENSEVVVEDVPTLEPLKTEGPKTGQPKIEGPKIEIPMTGAPTIETPKLDVPTGNTPKGDAPRSSAPEIVPPKSGLPD